MKKDKKKISESTEKIELARDLMGLMLTKGGFARFGYLTA